MLNIRLTVTRLKTLIYGRNDRQDELVVKEVKKIVGHLTDPSFQPNDLPELNKELRRLAFEVWGKHAVNSIRAPHSNRHNGYWGMQNVHPEVNAKR